MDSINQLHIYTTSGFTNYKTKMKKICTSGRSDNCSLFSAESVISNEDLQIQIFLCLPVRTLIRFKLVSKQWSSLISNPQFARDRTRQSDQNSVVPSGLYFYNSLTKSREIEYLSLVNNDSPKLLSGDRVPSLLSLHAAAAAAAAGSEITILQSCNGFLFCRFTSAFTIQYCVYNPTTKSYRIIPKLFLNRGEKAMQYAMAYDPSISPHYKIVCRVIVTFYSRIEIYSSETGKWSTSPGCSCVRVYNSLEESRFYWQGSIHWVTFVGSLYLYYKYDLEKDDFQELDLPPRPSGVNIQHLRYLGEYRGRLYLVYIRNRSTKKFQVLEMDRETMKWSVKYRVHICHLLSEFPEICVKPPSSDCEEYAFNILSVYKGEKEEDSALVLTIPGKVISYNLHHKTAKLLSELHSQEPIDTWGYHYFTGFNFIPSLAAV